MKQINEKLNKIAKAIAETVELPETNLITDSLDAITKALGGTPNDSNLIVDKLDDIAGVAEPKPTGNIELTENAENVDIAPYATATVNVSSGGGLTVPLLTMNITNVGEAQAEWNDFGLPIELAHIENNYLYIDYIGPNESVPSQETVSVKLIYGRSVENEVEKYTCAAPDGELTNLVNCTIQQGLFAPEIVITDPTQNSSIDVEVEGTR